jgi:hypothetical protein
MASAITRPLISAGTDVWSIVMTMMLIADEELPIAAKAISAIHTELVDDTTRTPAAMAPMPVASSPEVARR